VQAVQDPGQVGALWGALRAVGEAAEVPGKDAQLTALSEALILAVAQLGAGDGLPIAPGSPGTAEHQAAKLAVRYIHDNLSGALGIEEISSQVAISSRHFGRLFRRFTGTTPAAYVETARMDRARHLLAHTDRPIKDIAVTVGYPDHHHFSRVFARRYGKPPGRWREEGGAPPVIRNPGDLV
jgi:transcriptional regulator GlxA family with amidase domain